VSISTNETDGFVEQQIRRVSRNLLIWNGVVLGILAIAFVLLRTYLLCFLQGAQAYNDADILNAARGSGSGLIAYIEIRDHELMPTGYIEQSTQDGRVYSTMNYKFVAVGDKKMLVKATQDAKGDVLRGPLQFYSADTDRQARDAIVAKNPALKDQVLPVMLNAAAAFNLFGYIFFAIATPIFALCMFNIARALFLRKTSLHPVTRSLARHGDPFETGQAIDAEMAEDSALKLGKAFVTQNWLLLPTAFRLIACRLDDIVWAYPVVMSGANVATFAFRDGRMVGVPLHRNTPELLAHVYRRVPWAETGWDKERATKWQRWRAEFIAEVEARRSGRGA
jgi:hypothetical protein